MKKIFWLLSLVVPMSATAESIEIDDTSELFTLENLISHPASTEPRLSNSPNFFPGFFIPGFDSSLGTLQNVEVNLTSTWSLDVFLTVSNRGASTSRCATFAVRLTRTPCGLEPTSDAQWHPRAPKKFAVNLPPIFQSCQRNGVHL